MTEEEDRLLAALAWICAQYLETDEGDLDHRCMSAGEGAVARLVRHDLVEPGGRGGDRARPGRDFLASH